MMIVIEGADCTGKTTLGKRLCKEYDLAYKHMSAPGEGFDHLYFYVSNYEDKVLWDRYHLGALVYGWRLGLSNIGQMWELDAARRFLKERGVIVIVLHSTPRQIIDRFSSKDEDYSPGQVLEANELFRKLPDDWVDIRIDVTDKSVDQLVEEVKSWIEN